MVPNLVNRLIMTWGIGLRKKIVLKNSPIEVFMTMYNVIMCYNKNVASIGF